MTSENRLCYAKIDNNIKDLAFWNDVCECEKRPKGTRKGKEINLVDVETGIEVEL